MVYANGRDMMKECDILACQWLHLDLLVASDDTQTINGPIMYFIHAFVTSNSIICSLSNLANLGENLS